MAELKPCPFEECVNDDICVLLEQVGLGTYMHFAYCPECGARGPRRYSEDEAISAWNKRSE